LVEAGKAKDSSVFHYTIYDNPKISREEIEAIKASTPEDVWRQEYLAEVVEYSGVVYGEFTDSSIFDPSTRFIGHEKFPCVVGIDWGHWDDTGVAWLHISPKGEVIVSKEHVKGDWDTKRHSEVIQMYSKGRNVEPGNHVLDRSAFRSDGDSPLSIADKFREHLGFSLQRSEKDFNVGIDLMKRFLRGNGVKPWLYVSAGCSETLKALREWERGDHEPDSLAAIRYALVHAVRKKLTKFAESNVKVDFSALYDDSEERIKQIEGLRPPKSLFKKDRWDWDGEFGVPQIGGDYHSWA